MLPASSQNCTDSIILPVPPDLSTIVFASPAGWYGWEAAEPGGETVN